MIVPSTIVLPRDGSFALVFLGRVTVHDPIASVAAGANNLAEDLDRPEGGKARVEINFGGGEPGACLHSIFIKVGNGGPVS